TVNDGANGGTGAETLSAAALAGLAGTNNISVAARSTITFNNLGGNLGLQTTLNHSVTFTTDVAGGAAISFSNTPNTLTTAGGRTSFSAGTDLTPANLNSNGAAVALLAGTQAAGTLSARNILTAGSGNIPLQASNAAGGSIMQTGTAAGQAINATAT